MAQGGTEETMTLLQIHWSFNILKTTHWLGMSIFLSLKHNQTILLFTTPKKFHVLSKIAYVIMCIYILVQQNTILAIDFSLIVRTLASLPFPSSTWLIYSWHFCICLVEGVHKLVLLLMLSCKNFRGQRCSKQDGTALHLPSVGGFTSLNIGDGAFVF